jgi:hypothetical protein
LQGRYAKGCNAIVGELGSQHLILCRVEVFDNLSIGYLAASRAAGNPSDSRIESAHEPLSPVASAKRGQDASRYPVGQGEVSFFWRLWD